MATGLRDDIKTMQGRRQEAGQALNDCPDRWICLSPSLQRPGSGRGGWKRRRTASEGRGGRPSSFSGFVGALTVGTISLQSVDRFPSQGSNWGCQTVHLHGNDYFYFVAELSRRPWVCAKEEQREGSSTKLQIPYQAHTPDCFCLHNRFVTSPIMAAFVLQSSSPSAPLCHYR